MSFPDSWLDGLGLPDSAKYRLCGNAVVTDCARWLGERIMATLGDDDSGTFALSAGRRTFT